MALFDHNWWHGLTVIANAQGFKWKSILNHKTNLEGYNLSLSHGISSIISFLSKTIQFKEFKSSSEPLLQGALQYVLNQEIFDDSIYFEYPIWVSETGPDRTDSPLAWCYGDLGSWELGVGSWNGFVKSV